MRRVYWTDEARNNLLAIVEYIEQENPTAAREVGSHILSPAKLLGDVVTGHVGRVSGTFEKVVSDLPYILAYAIDEKTSGQQRIVILRVIHTSRRWNAGGWPL